LSKITIQEEKVSSKTKEDNDFEKDFLIPETDSKKRGRPPKTEIDKTVELKKDKGFLQNEEELSIPLKKSENKIETSKKSIEIPTNEKITELFENVNKTDIKETITEPIVNEEISQESLLVPSELKTPYLEEYGVEVLDAKAIPTSEVKKKNRRVDKFGIPIQNGEHLNFDKI